MSQQITASWAPSIPEFYAGRSIFITGATGFMGKVLVERLLSTCPDIGRLYLLMRTKKDVPPEKRLQQLKQSQVFDALKQNNPSQLDKLCIIPGDVSIPLLGISMESLAQLQDVSVVFHAAATIKFNEALRVAVSQNVRSVMRLMDICDRLPNVEAFVHVSTAYSNAEKEVVEERVYPPPANLEELIALVDVTPPHLLAEITDKYIAPKPNTYTFTKAMAENAVEQHTGRRYSVAIFRPTIVISAMKHPYPGWVENLNGPNGVIVGSGKGVLHVFPAKSNAIADMLPVDLAIDTLIAVGWETAIDRSPDVKVYNCSTCENPTTWLGFKHALRKHLRRHPLDNALWYPSAITIYNQHAERLAKFLLQTIPLYTLECFYRILGIKNKLNLITVCDKLSLMTEVVRFFAVREWRFELTNTRRLKDRLCEEDAKTFNLDPHTIDWDKHYEHFVKGTRKFMLKEKEQDINKARQHLFKLYILHYGLIFISLLCFLRVLLQNQHISNIVNGALRVMLSLSSWVGSHVF